jgi:hypothetical protein
LFTFKIIIFIDNTIWTIQFSRKQNLSLKWIQFLIWCMKSIIDPLTAITTTKCSVLQPNKTFWCLLEITQISLNLDDFIPLNCSTIVEFGWFHSLELFYNCWIWMLLNLDIWLPPALTTWN